MSALTPIRTVLTAVQKHPMLMSPVLLEKGLLQSPFHGVLAAEPSHEITSATGHCLEQGWLIRTSGFYPSLTLSPAGEMRLAATANGAVEASPERAYRAYRAYYRWRERINTWVSAEAA
jgi:hypothetical protein